MTTAIVKRFAGVALLLALSMNFSVPLGALALLLATAAHAQTEYYRHSFAGNEVLST